MIVALAREPPGGLGAIARRERGFTRTNRVDDVDDIAVCTRTVI
jgi:hypothetical protein